jgi:protein TonB
MKTLQLTSTFKLTLLASIAIHAVAFLQWGGMQKGFHQESSYSTLNIRLSQVTNNPEQARQTESRTETNPKTTARKTPRKIAAKQLQYTQTKSAPQQIQSGALRKTRGSTETGIEVKQQYIAQLLQHLDQYKTYPFIAQRRQLEGTVTMKIHLDNNGRLLQVHCLTGNMIFCKAASQTAREAAPMPQPPRNLTQRQFEYAMEYRLR